MLQGAKKETVSRSVGVVACLLLKDRGDHSSANRLASLTQCESLANFKRNVTVESEGELGVISRHDHLLPLPKQNKKRTRTHRGEGEKRTGRRRGREMGWWGRGGKGEGREVGGGRAEGGGRERASKRERERERDTILFDSNTKGTSVGMVILLSSVLDFCIILYICPFNLHDH